MAVMHLLYSLIDKCQKSSSLSLLWSMYHPSRGRANEIAAVQDLLSLAFLYARRALTSAKSIIITRHDAERICGVIQAMVAKLVCIDEDTVQNNDVKEITDAIDTCVTALESCRSMTTPTRVLFMSGPLARRLETSFTKVANLLDSLHSVNGNSASTPAVLREPALSNLHQRATRAAALYDRLLDGNLSEALKAAIVREALLAEGVAEAELSDPAKRVELARQLLNLLDGDTREWLDSREAEVITATAAALLYTNRSEILAAASALSDATASDAAAGSEANLSSHTAYVNKTSPSKSRSSSPSPPLALPAPSSPRSTASISCLKTFRCPITKRIMRDPVNTMEGHTYERSAAEKWLRDNDTDPLTGKVLRVKTLVPAWALKDAIDEWLSASGMTHDECDRMLFDDEVFRISSCSETPSSRSSSPQGEVERARKRPNIASQPAPQPRAVSRERQPPHTPAPTPAPQPEYWILPPTGVQQPLPQQQEAPRSTSSPQGQTHWPVADKPQAEHERVRERLKPAPRAASRERQPSTPVHMQAPVMQQPDYWVLPAVGQQQQQPYMVQTPMVAEAPAGRLAALGSPIPTEYERARERSSPGTLTLTPTPQAGPRPGGRPARLFVRTLTGKTYRLDVNLNDVILRLKYMIQEQDGSAVEQQRLVYNGGTLEDNRTLADYNIREGDTIYMALCIRGGKPGSLSSSISGPHMGM